MYVSSIFSLVTAAVSTGSQWTGLGLTASDWVAVAGFIAGVAVTVWKVVSTINKLTESIDKLNDSNMKRDKMYVELEHHIERHDRKFVKDEERINEIFHLLKGDYDNVSQKHNQK